MARLELTGMWQVDTFGGASRVRLTRRGDGTELVLDGGRAMAFLEQHGEIEAAHRQDGSEWAALTWPDCLDRLCREWMAREGSNAAA